MLYCLILFLSVAFGQTVDESSYQPDWAVHIEGEDSDAEQVAKELGYEFLGKVGNLENIYHFREKRLHSHRVRRSLELHSQRIKRHKLVRSAVQQKILKRAKRDVNFKGLEKRYFEAMKIDKMFNDPKWHEEWYLYDRRNLSNNEKLDMHVIPVWMMNITGRGAKITIVDDGLEHTHPDLIENYDPKCSTDINDNDDDPMPNTLAGTNNEHGTRCASEISMAANNGICGVGVAFNAKVGGIRMLDGPVTDLTEAKSLGFNNNYIDIYSASWGPLDNGKAMDKPGPLTLKALENGVKYGRNGKGNIFVWAGGNGGYASDSCSYDGYASSIYAICINSISPNNDFPDFCEKCPSTMASTYSTAYNYKSKLIAADIRGGCTNEHTGTSASAPLAAGIFALGLEANPDLTWRDIKHIISRTCQYLPLIGNSGWKQNAAGFWLNQKFGFGLLNAKAFVDTAFEWKTVPDLVHCLINETVNKDISSNVSQTVVIDGTPCGSQVIFIENVVIKVTIEYSNRGSLQITMMSPHGQNTTLLPPRILDQEKSGYHDWPLNSIHNWGESPNGEWTIFVEDKTSEAYERFGRISYVTMIFYGTAVMPTYNKTQVDVDSGQNVSK